jgi:predicted PurR-regulated permease PerM
LPVRGSLPRRHDNTVCDPGVLLHVEIGLEDQRRHAANHALPGKALKDSASRDIILWFFLALFLVSTVMLGWLMWPFFSIIVLAAVITGVFGPLFRKLNRRMRPSLASFTTCVIIFLVLFLPISFLVGILANEAYDLYLRAREAVFNKPFKDLIENSHVLEKVNFLLANFNITISAEELNQHISEIGRLVGLFLYQQATSITTNVFMFIVNFFFMLLIVFYLLIDSRRLIAFISSLSPLPDDQDLHLIQKFKDISGAILLGNGLGGLIQGTLGGIVFAVFGFRSPVLWGVVMGLLAFLPIAGIGAVLVPAAVYLFLKDHIAAGVFFLIFYAVVSGGVEYLFKPRLVGHRVQMHTLLVIFSIIGGLKLFGILGIIYGPLVVTAFLTLTDIYQSSYRRLIEPL